MSDILFNGDVYVFLPMKKNKMDRELKADAECPYFSDCKMKKGEKECPESTAFICGMKIASEANCSNAICKEIIRQPIGNFTIGIPPDTYFKNNTPMSTKADIVLVTHTKSPLALAVLIFKQRNFDVMRLLDRVSARKLEIAETKNDHQKLLIEYLEEQCNCKVTGEGKSLLCVPQKPSAGDIVSILSSEWRSSDVDYSYNLSPNVLKQESNKSIGEYNFATEFYVSQRTCICVLPSMAGRSFVENLEYEVLAVFIVELLMFRYNAIKSIGSQVSLLLAETNLLTLRMIKKLYIDFGKTLVFWEKDNYKYAGVQRIADSTAKHFKLVTEQKNFNRKLEQIKHIVDLHSSQQTRREGKLMIFLVVTQIVLIVIELLKS